MNTKMRETREFQYGKDVYDFNIIGGHALNKPTTEMVKTQCNLILEEYTELLEAIKESNEVETLDAIIDLAYVVIGLALMNGKLGKHDNIEILASNLTTISMPEIRHCSAVQYVCCRVNDLLCSMRHFGFKPNYISIPLCADIILLLRDFAIEQDYDFDGAWDEVQKSNMSKFCKDENGKLYAKHREDGKILKGPDYFRPDLAKFIIKEGE